VDADFPLVLLAAPCFFSVALEVPPDEASTWLDQEAAALAALALSLACDCACSRALRCASSWRRCFSSMAFFLTSHTFTGGHPPALPPAGAAGVRTAAFDAAARPAMLEELESAVDAGPFGLLTLVGAVLVLGGAESEESV